MRILRRNWHFPWPSGGYIPVLPSVQGENASLVRELTFLIWPKEKRIWLGRDSKKKRRKKQKGSEKEKAQKLRRRKNRCFMPQ